MPVPFLDLPAQYHALQSEIDPAIKKILETSAFILGPAVEQFEKDFAAFCGAAHCIGVNSGTSALSLLLRAHGIGKGDEVITVANTFFATLEAIIHVGATPVLVDCEESTALMNPDLLEGAITAKTKAILPVHIYGQTADISAVNAIAKKHSILVFEDACQAHGAREHGQVAGGLADGAAFSFYPGKNLGAYGEAGAITTNDTAIAKKIRMLRDHGSAAKYHHDTVGWNERMDGIQGAVLGVKLQHLQKWNDARRAHATTYRSLLPKNVGTIETRDGADPVYHLFVISTADRNALQAHLTAHGIQTGIHYPIPLHLQPACSGFGFHQGDFPVTEKLAKEILSLPMFPEMTLNQIQEVCDAIASFESVRAATGGQVATMVRSA